MSDQQTATKETKQLKGTPGKQPKPWKTVELPGHAIWEVRADTDEEAIREFIRYHHINETKEEYQVHEGQVKTELVERNKIAHKLRQKAS